VVQGFGPLSKNDEDATETKAADADVGPPGRLQGGAECGGCEAITGVMVFPFVLQITGTKEDSISIAILPAE